MRMYVYQRKRVKQVVYFAEKRREKVNISLPFSPAKKQISRRNFSAFRGEISRIETRNFVKFTVHFAEKKQHKFAEKNEKRLIFFTLTVLNIVRGLKFWI